MTRILRRYRDQDSLKQLEEQRRRLGDILAGLGLDEKGRDKMRLPKVLRDALQFLATNEEIELLTVTVQEQLEQADPSSASSENAALPFDPESNTSINVEWTEGVEEFQHTSDEELWNMLGFPQKAIPFFNDTEDSSGIHDPWTEEGKLWLQTPENGKELFVRWHQRVGLLKILINLFDGKSTFLLDEVGLGKTIQVTSNIATLTYYRDFYAYHGSFPGIFSQRKGWRPTVPNIPDLPMVVVVPVLLVNQFISELHKFLQRGSFDVLPYLGNWSSRQTWWTTIWERSKQPLSRRIIVTSPKAVESDFDLVLEADSAQPSSSPKEKPSFADYSSRTLYGRRYLCNIVDEAHNYRNIRKGFFAIGALVDRSEATCFLTATPGVGRASDLWNLGRCMRVEGFGSAYDREAEKMESRLRAAQTKDGKRMKSGDRKRKLVQAVIKGDSSVTFRTSYEPELLRWIAVIRNWFAGISIRRHLQSVDNTGARILGLGPIHKHALLVKLYQHELDNLEAVAEELIRDGTHRVAKSAGSADFYVHLRKALLHPSCVARYPWQNPTTPDEWRLDPSRKLDVHIEVIRWHLEKDGRAPLRVVDDRLVESPENPPPAKPLPKGTPCDKIVVYCVFPSNFVQLVKVLEIHGIKSLQLCGKTTSAARTRIVNQFRTSGADGIRVLVLSNVGQTGLNLPCANVMIIVDRLWADSEKGQLVGRINRHPQPKPVHVYQIIAADTQDVFLNSLSLGKAVIMDAFTGCTPSMRALFENSGSPDDSGDDSVSEDADELSAKKRSKGGRPKQSSEPRAAKGRAKTKQQCEVVDETPQHE